MKDLIADFSKHIAGAIQHIEQSNFRKATVPIHNVLITGVGGSGIGGTIVSEMLAPFANVPLLVNKNYHIPAFVNENTLVIACSYSGNTEETLYATKEALSRKAEIACITSGGKLLEIAKNHNLNVISMQGGHPPRSMFAYAFSYLCHILKFYDITPSAVIPDLQNAIKLLNTEEDEIRTEAKKIAEKLAGKTAIIYTVNGNLGIASRWRQQLNENAKMLAWEAEIPEMNHNELVGWEGGNSQFVPVFLRHKSDFERNQKRIEISKEILSKKTDTLLEVWSKGSSPIEKSLYLIHLGDWVSFYLSEINKVDILDIKSIDLLKSELSKL